MRGDYNLLTHLNDGVAPNRTLCIGWRLWAFLNIVNESIAGHLACGGHPDSWVNPRRSGKWRTSEHRWNVTTFRPTLINERKSEVAQLQLKSVADESSMYNGKRTPPVSAGDGRRPRPPERQPPVDPGCLNPNLTTLEAHVPHLAAQPLAMWHLSHALGHYFPP